MNPKAAYILLPAAAILATSIGAIGTYYATSRSPFEYAVRFLPLFRWPEFLTGVLLGYVYKLARTPKWIEAHGDVVATAGAILAAVLIMTFNYYTFLHSGGLTIPFTLIIIGLAEASGPIYRILSSPIAILLGEASYSIYILQIPLKYFVNETWASVAGDVARPIWFRGTTFLGIIAFSVLVNKLLENPARRAILKFAQAGTLRNSNSSG
jgi:peptidoglycan/LPS O-acetylase OafA/YrhL